jgi:hypothetical protein
MPAAELTPTPLQRPPTPLDTERFKERYGDLDASEAAAWVARRLYELHWRAELAERAAAGRDVSEPSDPHAAVWARAERAFDKTDRTAVAAGEKALERMVALGKPADEINYLRAQVEETRDRIAKREQRERNPSKMLRLRAVPDEVPVRRPAQGPAVRSREHRTTVRTRRSGSRASPSDDPSSDPADLPPVGPPRAGAPRHSSEDAA